MITTLKGFLFGVSLSVLGTIIYLVLYIWWSYRRARSFAPTGTMGFDVISLARNTIYAPAYWLFVLGLLMT
jgi:hypothetical protein